MKIDMLRNLIGVQKLSKNTGNEMFANVDVVDNMGIIRYVGEEVKSGVLKPGTKIYYGDNRQQIRMAGEDILIMEDTNIIARVKEDLHDEEEVSQS